MAKRKYIVRLNMAQTIDGHTISPENNWNTTSKEDKRRMDRLRLWADCIITSRKTIVNDNPNLYLRTREHSKHHPRPVIIQNVPHTPFSPETRVFQPPHPTGEIWYTGNQDTTIPLFSSITHQRLEKWERYRYQKLREIIDSLSQRGYRNILLEGGPTLNGLFFEEQLVDELFCTIVPALWGDFATDRLLTTKHPLPPVRLRLLNEEKRKDELYLRYKVLKQRDQKPVT